MELINVTHSTAVSASQHGFWELLLGFELAAPLPPASFFITACRASSGSLVGSDKISVDVHRNRREFKTTGKDKRSKCILEKIISYEVGLFLQE